MAKWRRKEKPKPPADPVARWTLIALGLSLLLFGLVTIYFLANPGQIPPRQAGNYRFR
jgi:hypothetical protein